MQEIKKSLIIATALIVCLMLSSTVQAITIKVFVTSTTTTTSVSTSKIICAKLVNVTGPCRRRRDFQFEQPEILTFDDDIEDSVDNALKYIPKSKQFIATKTLSMEVTPLMKPLESTSASYSTPSSISNPLIQSSLSHSNKRRNFYPIENTKKRIFFSAFHKFSRFPTETYTTTTTVTETLIKTTTASFFISHCTPSPFPLNICKKRH